MVAVANVFYNLTAWASGQTITIGAWRSSDGSAWQASSAGTTGSTAPTGTTDSNDGSVQWTYKAHIDFTDINDYLNSFSSMTEPHECWFWNNGETIIPQNHAISNNYIQDIANHGVTSSNTLTIKAAPGQSFADNPQAQDVPLAYNPANGAAIRPDQQFFDFCGMFTLRESVTFEGLQFHIPRFWRSMFCVTFGTVAATFRNCIFDFYPIDISGPFQINWGSFDQASHYVFENCLFIDRQDVGTGCLFITLNSDGSAGSATNCTFIAVNNPGGTAAPIACKATFGTIRNCAFFGYDVPFATVPGTTTSTLGVSDHNIFSSGSVDATLVEDANSQFGKPIVAQFMDALSDYRLRLSAACIDAGTSTNAPAVDIVNTDRPQGNGVDIGCWEYIPGSQTVAATGAIITFLG